MDTTMGTTMDTRGSLTEADDGSMALRYERQFPRPITTVWAAITQPDRLADWLGPCTIEPHVGGRFDVSPGGRVQIAGRVLAWEPPALLECSWAWPDEPETVVRYELHAEGAHATRLVFTHSGMRASRVTSTRPGWHVFMERLAAVVDGDPAPAIGDLWPVASALYAEQASAG